MDGAQRLDTQCLETPLARDFEATTERQLDPLDSPGRIHREIVDDRQDAKGVAISNMNTAGLGRLGLPGISHDSDRVLTRFEDRGRGAQRKPGIVFQNQSLNRERRLVMGRNGHHPATTAGRSDKAQGGAFLGDSDLDWVQHTHEPVV